MKRARLGLAAASVLVAGASAWAQDASRPVGVHGNVIWSFIFFFPLALIALYVVFKGIQSR